MVISQAVITFSATCQRTADARRAAPAPMMQPVIVWVVDTGMPNHDAVISMTEPPARCAETLMLGQLGDAGAHRLDDPPAAGQCAQADRDVAADRHPVGNVKIALQIAGRVKQDGDDPHRLLRVVEAVADRIGRRRYEVQDRNVRSAPAAVARTPSQLVSSMISIASIMPSVGDRTIAIRVLLSPVH